MGRPSCGGRRTGLSHAPGELRIAARHPRPRAVRRDPLPGAAADRRRLRRVVQQPFESTEQHVLFVHVGGNPHAHLVGQFLAGAGIGDHRPAQAKGAHHRAGGFAARRMAQVDDRVAGSQVRVEIRQRQIAELVHLAAQILPFNPRLHGNFGVRLADNDEVRARIAFEQALEDAQASHLALIGPVISKEADQRSPNRHSQGLPVLVHIQTPRLGAVRDDRQWAPVALQADFAFGVVAVHHATRTAIQQPAGHRKAA